MYRLVHKARTGSVIPKTTVARCWSRTRLAAAYEVKRQVSRAWLELGPTTLTNPPPPNTNLRPKIKKKKIEKRNQTPVENPIDGCCPHPSSIYYGKPPGHALSRLSPAEKHPSPTLPLHLLLGCAIFRSSHWERLRPDARSMSIPVKVWARSHGGTAQICTRHLGYRWCNTP